MPIEAVSPTYNVYRLGNSAILRFEFRKNRKVL